MELNFKKCNEQDLITLQTFSRATFDATFRHMNTPETMAAYLDSAFNTEKLRSELTEKDSEFHFLFADSTLAGYIKLNERQAQTDINDPQSLELERIYVSPEFQAKGLGKVLMRRAIETAESREKDYIWLGVWEKNEKAIAFYKKNGFVITGKHSFIMGEEAQSDFIMRKDL